MNDIRDKLKGGGALPRVKTILLNGVGLKVYSIGWLALYSRASRQSLRLWERNKILPPAILTIEQGYRWYSGAEVIEYSKIISAYFLSKPRSLKTLRTRLGEKSIQIRNAYKLLSKESKVRYSEAFFAIPNESAAANEFKKARATKRITSILPKDEPQDQTPGNRDVKARNKDRRKA